MNFFFFYNGHFYIILRNTPSLVSNGAYRKGPAFTHAVTCRLLAPCWWPDPWVRRVFWEHLIEMRPEGQRAKWAFLCACSTSSDTGIDPLSLETTTDRQWQMKSVNITVFGSYYCMHLMMTWLFDTCPSCSISGSSQRSTRCPTRLAVITWNESLN